MNSVSGPLQVPPRRSSPRPVVVKAPSIRGYFGRKGLVKARISTGETVEHKITWVGDVHALFIDDRGYMYEDTDGDRTLKYKQGPR